MRSKWYKSDAPALQMALMKLIATPQELRKLSMQYIESENINHNSKPLSPEEIKKMSDELNQKY